MSIFKRSVARLRVHNNSSTDIYYYYALVCAIYEFKNNLDPDASGDKLTFYVGNDGYRFRKYIFPRMVAFLRILFLLCNTVRLLNIFNGI